MEINNLLEKLKSYLSEPDHPDKKFYRVILSSLEDNSFVTFLSESDKNSLNNISNDMQGERNVTWYKDNNPSVLNPLNDIYFKALSYLNNERKNVSHFENRTKELEEKITNAQSDIDRISKTAKLITDVTILSAYAEDFNNQAIQHATAARTWMTYLIISIIGFVVVLVIVIFFNISEFPILKNALAEDLRRSNNLSILILAIKAALIFAYLQIPYFIKRNYFAEKHLEQACIHRRDVLKALHAVYNTIADQNEKDRIITTGAAIAFSEAESGYITRKEGAGSEDLTETMINKFWNK